MKTELTTIPAPNRDTQSEFRILNYHVRLHWRGTCWVVESARDILAHHERHRFIPVTKEHWQKVRVSRLSRGGPPYQFLMEIASQSLVTLEEIAGCYRRGLEVLRGSDPRRESTRRLGERVRVSLVQKLAHSITLWKQGKRAQPACAR